MAKNPEDKKNGFKENRRNASARGGKVNMLEEVQRYYHQRSLSARKWKQQGGKVAGYFCALVPEEILMAAGYLPIRITGDPSLDTNRADTYMEDFFCPWVRSMYTMLLTGRYDFLDLLVIPHSCDSVMRAYFYLLEEARRDSSVKIPTVIFLDIPHTKFGRGSDYALDRTMAFKQEIEQICGWQIPNSDLSKAIAVCNENRNLLKQISALRKADPPLLSGTEALQVILPSMLIPKREHNELLKKILEGADQLTPKIGQKRIFIAGSAIDHLEMYQLVERLGAVIVGEDICTGDRYSDNLVDESLDPIMAIADRYHLKSPCARTYPLKDKAYYMVQEVQEAKASSVIFFYYQWCDSNCWDYVTEREMLENLGIQTLCFEMQEYHLRGSEQMRTRIEALLGQ